MSKYIHEHVFDLQKMGWKAYRDENRSPVLIGIGLVGELRDVTPGRPREATLRSKAKQDETAVETESLAGRVWPIKRGGGQRGDASIRVGRTTESDVVIPEYSLSRVHCAFKYVLNGLTVFDCGSTNGTQVNGQLLEAQKPARIKSGVELILGRFKFEFLSNEIFLNRIRELVGPSRKV
jgi:pSer/pThr/pTyr-binding forkhead associated (FHA) protein